MPKITRSTRSKHDTVVVKTKDTVKYNGVIDWWNASSKSELNNQQLATATILKENQQYRYRQSGIYSRLYSNLPMFGWIGTNLTRMSVSTQLPTDRPTMNVIQSCIDTLVSRITQSRPRPVFLTDNGDYRQRKLAKELNAFIQGEFYQTKAHELGVTALRDASVLGTGCIKCIETQDKKVGLERTILTELLVDPNEAMYGFPRQLHQLQLVDRDVLANMFPEKRSMIKEAEQAYPDSGGDSTRSVSDQVMTVESWHIPSGPGAKDGLHVIGCTAGSLMDEPYEKDRFPFSFLHYSPRMLGFWGQPLTEQLMGIQVEINKLLMTISQSINLVGVPRVFVEDGSKVVKAHLNNQIGTIVTYRGTKPVYEVAPCVPQEIYAQLQRLVDYAYQQSGISALAAASQKPSGLNSGVAMREYDNLQSDRFASLEKRYDDFYIDLSYLVTDKAMDIAEREGSYQTVFPDKNGTQQVDLPAIEELRKNPFVIQAFDSSSLPKDPAGRKQEIVDLIQSGMISPQEGRRLLDFPDLEQENKLATAAEERILKILDNIVQEGIYEPPDPFMDLQLADQITVQYYNLYSACKLEEEKAQMLRNFSTQVKALVQAAMPPPQPQLQPQASPEALPTNPMIPNVPGAA